MKVGSAEFVLPAVSIPPTTAWETAAVDNELRLKQNMRLFIIRYFFLL